MPEQDRRTSRRLIMRVPLRFRPMKATSIPEETAASMNISTHGVFFATEQKVSKGLLLQVHLKQQPFGHFLFCREEDAVRGNVHGGSSFFGDGSCFHRPKPQGDSHD